VFLTSIQCFKTCNDPRSLFSQHHHTERHLHLHESQCTRRAQYTKSTFSPARRKMSRSRKHRKTSSVSLHKQLSSKMMAASVEVPLTTKPQQPEHEPPSLPQAKAIQSQFPISISDPSKIEDDLTPPFP
jgi:hypothetical protein